MGRVIHRLRLFDKETLRPLSLSQKTATHLLPLLLGFPGFCIQDRISPPPLALFFLLSPPLMALSLFRDTEHRRQEVLLWTQNRGPLLQGYPRLFFPPHEEYHRGDFLSARDQEPCRRVV